MGTVEAVTHYPRFLPDGRRYVKGDGPLPCDTLFLGESPGDDEDNTGQAFVGRTGQLLDALCARAGWRRGVDFRVENVLRYKPELCDKGGPILPSEIERDRPRLLEQFAKCQPRLVFAMGTVAMDAVLGAWLRGQGVEPRLDWMWGLAFDVVRPDTAVRVVHKTERHDVYIGRPSPWGNPFKVGEYGRSECIRRYRKWLLTQPDLVRRAKTELAGKVLGCWCKPLACHGDVLAELAAETVRVVPTFHPAAGFHDPVMAARFWRSLTGLRTARVWKKDTRPVEYRAC